MQVGHTLAQRLPFQFTLRGVPHRPKHLQAARVVDRRLHPQHLPLLIVKLHAVKSVSMFDPHSLRAMLQVADYFPGEAAVHATLCRDLLLEEPQYVPAAERRDPMMHQPGKQSRQGSRRAEYHIRGPLALLDRPVIAHRPGGVHPLGVHRMELAHQLVQGDRPVDQQLRIEQGLSAPKSSRATNVLSFLR